MYPIIQKNQWIQLNQLFPFKSLCAALFCNASQPALLHSIHASTPADPTNTLLPLRWCQNTRCTFSALHVAASWGRVTEYNISGKKKRVPIQGRGEDRTQYSIVGTLSGSMRAWADSGDIFNHANLPTFEKCFCWFFIFDKWADKNYQRLVTTLFTRICSNYELVVKGSLINKNGWQCDLAYYF